MGPVHRLADAGPEIMLAQPRGFCAGVVRAVEIVERALELLGAPVYVFHEIVHNGHVVASLRERGAVFVDDIDSVPCGSALVFSAHGVSLSVMRQAYARALDVIDATCPLVSKVHQEIERYAAQGRALVMIGHAGHDEVVGTMGRVREPVHRVGSVAEAEQLVLLPDARPAYVVQTTLSLDDTREIIATLRRRFPGIAGRETEDICYATQNRQDAVRALAAQVDRVLVVGAANSSNSQRLREVAEAQGTPARLIADASGIDPAWLAPARRIGVTAGASTPEALVQGVLRSLRELGAHDVRQLPGREEGIVFRLPVALLRRAA